MPTGADNDIKALRQNRGKKGIGEIHCRRPTCSRGACNQHIPQTPFDQHQTTARSTSYLCCIRYHPPWTDSQSSSTLQQKRRRCRKWRRWNGLVEIVTKTHTVRYFGTLVFVEKKRAFEKLVQGVRCLVASLWYVLGARARMLKAHQLYR
ncbi:unnamed protein product, partial [Ectocarpus sp. 13 AM-2016]